MTPAELIGPMGTGADVVRPPRSIRRASSSAHRRRRTRSAAIGAMAGILRMVRGARCRSAARGPETVAAYIAECAGRLKAGSIQRRLNAIAEAHKAAGLDSPTAAGMVKNVMKGIRRTLGTAPVQKSPALTDDIRAMVDAADAGLIGARDRALILLGFAGAFVDRTRGARHEDCRSARTA